MPAALPATAQAATITHGDIKLHIDCYDILIYAIQIMIVMVVLSAIVWTCIQIWNCINTRNLGKLQEKLNFMQFLSADKTELYFQFMSNYMTWSVYLHSVYDNPEGIEAGGQFLNGDVTLFKGCVFNFLTIQWNNINLSQHDLDLWLPSSLPVSMTSKLFLRKLFENPNTLFRIIAYNPQNGQVRPITSLYKLLPVEEVVSGDVRTHQLEIAFSTPEEQALYEECPPKMEYCVYSPDDEVPELDSIPELTPEEKESQELKADKDFDQDTEIAIQQSLDYYTTYQQLRNHQPQLTQTL